MIQIRKTLNNVIGRIENERVYVLLSSGLDSQSLLFSSLELNKDVVIVSFTLKNKESRDFKKAKSIAEKLNLEFLPVYLPSDIKTLSQHVLSLANKYKCKSKTEFECTYPMLFAYKEISNHANGKATIVSGLGADCFYVLSKRGILHFKDKPDEFREATFFKENYCQKLQHEILMEEYNLEHVMPYLSMDVFNLFKGTTWEECNKPQQKNPVREQYKDELISGHFFKHTNFQLGDSGIADSFTQLLDTEWNFNNWKSVIGIYNAVVSGKIDKPVAA